MFRAGHPEPWNELHDGTRGNQLDCTDFCTEHLFGYKHYPLVSHNSETTKLLVVSLVFQALSARVSLLIYWKSLKQTNSGRFEYQPSIPCWCKKTSAISPRNNWCGLRCLLLSVFQPNLPDSLWNQWCDPSPNPNCLSKLRNSMKQLKVGKASELLVIHCLHNQ